MSTTEPSIKITRKENKVASIAVVMPFRVEKTFDGYLRIYMPLFHTQTWAKDESDVEKAIEDCVLDYCRAAEKFGVGLEKELEGMGWVVINNKPDEQAFEFHIKNIDATLGLSRSRCFLPYFWVWPRITLK